MKKLVLLSINLSFVAVSYLNAGFDWGGSSGECSGDGSFKQQIKNKDFVLVGKIPSGKEGVYVKLTSTKDVDIQIWDGNKAIVGWNIGALIGEDPKYNLSTTYNNMKIEYSGYNGDGTGLGHEFIKIDSTTRELTMKAYGYEAGYATVDYSWSGTKNCESNKPAENGAGTFQQHINYWNFDKENATTVGTIPSGITDVYISLVSDEDVDIRLYDNGVNPIVHWPDGILNNEYGQSTMYNGIGIEYSGYNGDGTGLGHEYIRMIGTTKTDFTMKAFGYKAGYATVNYSWGHLWHPCSSCEESGPYNREWHGDNTNHLAQDYPAEVGDSVRAVADGQVYEVYDSIGGFGGYNPSRNGPAIVIRHKKSNGTIFFALYGHISSNLSKDDFVKGNQIIGTVEDYLYGSGDNIQHWPHLHFGIWDAENNFPTTGLGYGTDRSFVNPVPFLENTQYKAWETE